MTSSIVHTFFFFSSRRRHTRFDCDWSSDVCSSDLSHALMVLLFYPFGFRITSITLFRVQPKPQVGPSGRVMQKAGRLSLQLGEVQYVQIGRASCRERV